MIGRGVGSFGCGATAPSSRVERGVGMGETKWISLGRVGDATEAVSPRGDLCAAWMPRSEYKPGSLPRCSCSTGLQINSHVSRPTIRRSAAAADTRSTHCTPPGRSSSTRPSPRVCPRRPRRPSRPRALRMVSEATMRFTALSTVLRVPLLVSEPSSTSCASSLTPALWSRPVSLLSLSRCSRTAICILLYRAAPPR